MAATPPRPFATWDDYRRQLRLFVEEDVMGREELKLADDGVRESVRPLPPMQRHASDTGKIARWCEPCGLIVCGTRNEINGHAVQHEPLLRTAGRSS